MKDPNHGLALSAASPAVATSSKTTSSTTSRRWNTKNLSSRIFADFASAASAGVMVAPIISIIDRSIMENASGRATLSSSIRSSLRTLFLSPRTILLSKPSFLIFCLYGGTYLTANTIDTATSTMRSLPARHTTSGGLKFAASSTTNISVCIYKDQVFVRMFGPPGVVPRPVPLPSYALFAIRDCMTIFASFNVPPLIAPYIDSKMSDELRRRVSGLSVAQFAAPAAVQLLSTPLHLLGLDLYNRPSAATGGAGTAGSTGLVSWADRWQLIRSNWAISVVARICRIVPAYGVGGVVNTKVRKNLMEKLE